MKTVLPPRNLVHDPVSIRTVPLGGSAVARRVPISPFYKLVSKFVELVTGIHIDPPTGRSRPLLRTPRRHLDLARLCAGGQLQHLARRDDRPRGPDHEAAPRLGERVWVGPNAVISGPVRVGSGAVVAANTLVVANVPENAVVIGVPARVLSYSGSGNLIDLPEAGGRPGGMGGRLLRPPRPPLAFRRRLRLNYPPSRIARLLHAILRGSEIRRDRDGKSASAIGATGSEIRRRNRILSR